MPLLVPEASTSRIAALFRDDPDIFTWWGTRIECTSAVARRARTTESRPPEADEALRRLHELSGRWQEVAPANEVRSIAEELLAQHPLRAADSLQLASAVAISRRVSAHLEFVSLDRRLNEAAKAEGFRVVESGE